MSTKLVNGQVVELTAEEEEALFKEWEKNVKEQQHNEYRQLRQAAYPSIVEQLDILFHEGFDNWKSKIQAIKDKYPKPV